MKYNVVGLLLLSFIFSFFMCGCRDEEGQKAIQENKTLTNKIAEMENRIKLLEKQVAELDKEKGEISEEKSRLARMLTDAGLSTNPDETAFNECKENLKKISLGLRLYAAENKKYPKKLSDISPDPRYLDIVPTCPAVTRDTYTTGYTPARDLKSYKVCCYGHNHGTILIKENFPAFDSREGLLVERDKEKTEEDEFIDEDSSKSDESSADDSKADKSDKSKAEKTKKK